MLFSDYNSYNKASAFYLLASSSLSESVKARIKITNWFNEYSDYSKMDFLQRFKSNDDMSFYSAFTELFTFQLFNSNGFEVKRGEAKMPDFSAEKDGFKILIECTLSGDSIMKSSAHKFLNSFSEKIDEIDSDYFISTLVEHSGSSEPSLGILKRILKRIIDDNSKSKSEDHVIKVGDWIFRVSFISKVDLNYRKSHGTLSTGFVWANAPKYLKQAIHDKRPKKYLFKDEPYIIVVNSLERGLTDMEVRQALYGDSKWDAFFDHDKNTSISGVIIINRLFPQWIDSSKTTFYENPWAKYKVRSKLENIPSLIMQSDRKT